MRRSLVPGAAFLLLLAGCGSGPPQLPSLSATGGSETAAAADMSMRIANIRYELADGVKADKDHQDAYRFGGASLDDAKRIAKAFGVSGAVHADEFGWAVGARDDEPATKEGAAMSLYLGRNGTFSVNGSYPVSSGVACAEPADQSRPPAMAGGVTRCEATTTTINPSLPTEDEAKKLASDRLKAAGIDIQGAEVSVTTAEQVVSVRFEPVFEGRAVAGVEMAVTLGPDNAIAYASGFVGDAKSVGSYELASLARAVERLNARSTYPAADDMRTLTADGREPASPGMAPIEDPGGGGNPPEPVVVKLTGVRVGLMMTSDGADGSLWLTPAYVFETDNQGTVLAPAAHDKYLPSPTTTAPGKVDEPTGTAVPPASGGGAGGGSTGNPGTSEGSTGSAPVTTVPEGGYNDTSSSGRYAGVCESVDGPIQAYVCADRGTLPAGEALNFKIYATDGDRAFSEGPCFDGVTADYGDADSPGEVQCMACSTGVPEGPGKMSRSRAHTYAKAGQYTPSFTLKSGSDCGAADPRDSSVTLTLKITVT